MIRVIVTLPLLAGCAQMPPAPCPEPQVTALICPARMDDYYDDAYMRELAEESAALPPDSALGKALLAYQAVLKKCDSI